MKRSDKDASGAGVVPAGRIARAILLILGQRVLLDADLAELYEIETKALTRASSRSLDRFPADFMFRLTNHEVTNLRCQIGTSRSPLAAGIHFSLSSSSGFPCGGVRQ